MKRLFRVNNEFFGDKKAAKAARGEPTKKAQTETVNGRTIHYPATYASKVELGPDHRHYAGR